MKMPNWCNNTIIVRGSQQREINRLVEAFKAGEFCNAVIPIPEELQNPATGSFGGEDAEAKDKLREQLTAKYGYSGWYDFCTGRWGTKWDVGGDDSSIDVNPDGLQFIAHFESAWAPPIGVYEALVEQGLEVEAYYYECGMGFAGHWDNGIDDCVSDIGTLTPDEIRENYPEIDEHFGISDQLEEMREEELMQDDLYRWTKEGGEKLELIER
jgi:hypothetical protein